MADCVQPFSQWRLVLERLEREHPDAVIVWGGDTVADAVFLAMACDRLAGRSDLLLRVPVPGVDGRHAVAIYAPEDIARLYARRRPLSAADREALAQDFARIRDTCGPVRRLEQGRVLGVPVDYYDPLLLDACNAVWQPSGLVVGTAMGHCDGSNMTDDGFFFARLGALVDGGRIEARASGAGLRDVSVRLVPPADTTPGVRIEVASPWEDLCEDGAVPGSAEDEGPVARAASPGYTRGT